MKRCLILTLIVAGCGPDPRPAAPPVPVAETKPVAAPKPVGVTPANYDFFDVPTTFAPRVERLELPPVRGGCALWGATGSDHKRSIHLGVSIDGVDRPSARLLTYSPDRYVFVDRGGVLENLQRLGKLRPGEGQNKIHTKILQAADGLDYFASMDESGEAEDGSRLPAFGSHLWRFTPGEGDWQHLGAVPEAIIAAAVGGRFVYYLGYYNHVLYQFDTVADRIVNKVAVGSVGGHTTRNFIADSRGHVFVPRVTKDKATLVEFNDELQEVAAFELKDYSLTPDASSHGIVGIAPLMSGGWCFTTDRGRLYRLDPRATGTTLTDLGMIHPQGEAYCAALVCLDGETTLLAVGSRHQPGEPQYDAIQFDLNSKSAKAVPLKLPIVGDHRGVLVYGSMTRDDRGGCYLVGRYLQGRNSVPAAWRLQP